MSRGFGAVALTAGLIAGCGVSQAPAAQPAASTYELVLMLKPENVEAYAKLPLIFYDQCLTTAKLLHFEVKPLPKFPATLGATRETYLFRGRDTVIRKEDLGDLDTTNMQPEKGCEVVVSTATHLNVDMQVGDMHTSITTDPDGHLNVQTEDAGDLMRADASMPMESAASYSERLTLNGIELRCLPETDHAEQACVYGRDDGMVPEPHGRLIIIAARFKPIPNLPNRMVLEPQSLRLIEHPDPKLFSAANYTR